MLRFGTAPKRINMAAMMHELLHQTNGHITISSIWKNPYLNDWAITCSCAICKRNEVVKKITDARKILKAGKCTNCNENGREKPEQESRKLFIVKKDGSRKEVCLSGDIK